MTMELLEGSSITAPKGFTAGAVEAGIKEKGGLDLALLYSELPATAAGVFTTNRVKAAPLLITRRNLRRGRAQGVIVNSGCANAGVGPQGLKDAREMARLGARKLGLAEEMMIIASTGVIGVPLPMERIRRSVNNIRLSREGGRDFARAIMTTDTRPKEAAVKADSFTIAGAAKGAGMIHPQMATMLAFLTTDAAVEPDFLRRALRRAVDNSFNMITVDGDTSTNDMVVILANGAGGEKAISDESPEAEKFEEALCELCLFLARSIVRDGEGASKLIEVRVKGARSTLEARRAARTIAGSSLVKTAVFGSHPNWGRILAALGKSGVRFSEKRLEIRIGNLWTMQGGAPASFDERAAREYLSQPEVTIEVNLNAGPDSATAWGCDLTPEYVMINSEYIT